MKSLGQFAVWVVLFGSLILPARAGFTSLYVFGDGVCTTTNSPGGALFYGNRYCNGRVWIEVLAQWQGVEYQPDKNRSYFGHNSVALVQNLNNFSAPPDAGTALFVVWNINADFVFNIQNYAPYSSNNLAVWNNAVNQSLTNHLRAVTNLYAKGARTLILPTAADITKVPEYPGLSASEKNFIRQRIVGFNTAYAGAVSNLLATLPSLTVYMPDTLSLLDAVLANPSSYGFTNIGSALDAGFTVFTGPGTNYVFWDYMHPTARMQMLIADTAQRLLSPPGISQLVPLPDSNRLDLANVPIGRAGLVEGSTNFLSWGNDQSFSSTNSTQSIFVPQSDPMRFYRLRFPFVWTWP